MADRGRSMSRSSRSTPAKRLFAPSRSSSRQFYERAYQPGVYVGRLPKPKRLKKISKYDKAGHSAVGERYGTTDQAQSAYLGFTSFSHADMGKVIGVAFIRKLMYRHYKMEFNHPDQKLSINTGQVSGVGPTQIQFYYEEILSSDAEPSIAVGATFVLYNTGIAGGNPQSLNDFATWFYNNVLTNSNFGGTQAHASYPIRRLHGYQFIEPDYTVPSADPDGAPLPRYSTLFPLKNQYLTVNGKIGVVVQNATPSDGGLKNTDLIDVNPLKAKMFAFSDLLPRLAQRRGALGTVTSDNSWKLQIDPNGDGVIKPSASITGDWANSPIPAMFDNCTGYSSFILQPGQIKSTSLKFKFNGTIEKFMNGFAAFEFPLQKGAFGTSRLFCFEKMLPTGESSVIVNFNVKYWYGCVWGKRLGTLMQRTANGDAAVTDA